MSSGFVTEAEIEQKKKLRQAEWEKVRNPEDPSEAPEAPIDNRSLYDKLQEQKLKKDEEFEESRKLKNLVKVLDDDEADFLDLVDKLKYEEDRKKRMQEAQELSEFRAEAAKLRSQGLEQQIKKEVEIPFQVKCNDDRTSNKKEGPEIGIKRKSQSQLLSHIIKKPNKSSDIGEPEKAQKNKDEKTEQEGSKVTPPVVPCKGNLVCIGVLPGLASYSDSSDDRSSSDSDTEDSFGRDLYGRKIAVDCHKSSEAKTHENKSQK